VSGGIVKKFEAVENLDSATPLNADDATVDSWRRKVAGTAIAGGEVVLRSLGLDPSVMI